MHVALMMDHDRLRHEHVMLKRLSIGLLDMGVRLTRIIPDEIDSEAVLDSERRLGLISRLAVPMRVLPWRRTRRTEELAAAMERSLPDVLFAVGHEMWPLALDLANLIERPVALDVSSVEFAEMVPRRRAARNVAGYVAPTAPLAAMLRQRVDADLVSLVPIGVAISSRAVPARSGPSKTVAVIGACHDMQAYTHILAGLKQISADVPELQIVLELRGQFEHEIWRQMDRSGLHPIVSPIQDASLHRSLITQCDALVLPERSGQVSSLLLECMAVGMKVAAREDPILDMLEDDVTAVLLPDNHDMWESRLRRALLDEQVGQRISVAARAMGNQRHQSSRHVRRLFETFERTSPHLSGISSNIQPASRSQA